MAKSLVRMECAERLLMSTSSAISQIVTRSFHITLAITWSFWLVEGRLEHEVQPSLNWLYHSLICVMSIASSLKAIQIFSMISTWLSLSFWLFHQFIYNENPTRALNTSSLKCCLPSMDAIVTGEETFMHTYDGSRLLHACAPHLFLKTDNLRRLVPIFR